MKLIASFTILSCLFCLLGANSNENELQNNGIKLLSAKESISDHHQRVPCLNSLDTLKGKEPYNQECLTKQCGRRIIDGLFEESDINKLLSIARKGMSYRNDSGGPTILDINTGYIRDRFGLDNLFMKSNEIYTADEFAHYGKMIHRLKEKVMETFQLNTLYFTAPTFITRINSAVPWAPVSIHDEYWHPHVDMNNTEHYQYSGLLYLSTYEDDFSGGRLHFVDPHQHDHFDSTFAQDLTPSLQQHSSSLQLTVEPRKGRMAIFSSGMENTHLVEQVHGGERFVLSFWFTCNQAREFQIFLDGQAHITFSKRFKESMLKRNTNTKVHYAAKEKGSGVKMQASKEL